MSCQEGFTNQYHLFGVSVNTCVSISIPNTLCLIAMILSLVNVPLAAINLVKSLKGIKARQDSQKMSMYSSFNEALKQFPMLNFMLTSIWYSSFNAIQFAMIYFLKVTISTGSTNSLIASIARILFIIFRARGMFLAVDFLNGFADDFWKFYPISKTTRSSVLSALHVFTWISVGLIAILYIVMSQLPVDAEQRIWLAKLAFVIEAFLSIPTFMWNVAIALNLRSMLYKFMTERKEDKKREQLHKDFTSMVRASLPVAIVAMSSLIPAIYPPSANYMVPLKEIVNIIAAVGLGFSVKQLYAHREDLKNSMPKSSGTGSNHQPSSPKTAGNNSEGNADTDGQSIAPIVPNKFKMVMTASSSAESP